MIKRVCVVAAIIKMGRKVLITQRKPNCKYEPNRWEFPGGKVREGETPEQSLKREIEEELGASIRVGGLFGESIKKYEEWGEEIVISFYFAKLAGKRKPSAIGCQAVKWIRIDEIEEYDFVDADRMIISLLQLEEQGLDDEAG
jgi:8-oxo-dGTP diphosphatase